MTSGLTASPTGAPGVDDRGGSASVEAALLAAVFGLLIGFAIAGGRLVGAEAAADHAARSAARVASLQRDSVTAVTSARVAADESLAQQGLHCSELQVDVDASGYAVPLGTPGSVTATVRCVIDWSDLGLPVSNGGPAIESTAVSPVDRWRERT